MEEKKDISIKVASLNDEHYEIPKNNNILKKTDTLDSVNVQLSKV